MELFDVLIRNLQLIQHCYDYNFMDWKPLQRTQQDAIAHPTPGLPAPAPNRAPSPSVQGATFRRSASLSRRRGTPAPFSSAAAPPSLRQRRPQSLPMTAIPRRREARPCGDPELRARHDRRARHPRPPSALPAALPGAPHGRDAAASSAPSLTRPPRRCPCPHTPRARCFPTTPLPHTPRSTRPLPSPRRAFPHTPGSLHALPHSPPATAPAHLAAGPAGRTRAHPRGFRTPPRGCRPASRPFRSRAAEPAAPTPRSPLRRAGQSEPAAAPRLSSRLRPLPSGSGLCRTSPPSGRAAPAATWQLLPPPAPRLPRFKHSTLASPRRRAANGEPLAAQIDRRLHQSQGEFISSGQ